LPRLRLVTIALFGVALLAMNACSSTKKSSSGNAPATGGSASKLTGAPIVVGSICSCSGVAASTLGLNAKAMHAWEAWTNNHGGINGHPVKVITEDDQQNPATALQQVKKLIDNDHVMAIVGQASLVDETWASYAQQKGVPVVGGNTADSPASVNPDFFPSGSTFPFQIVGQFQVLQQRGLKNLGIFYCAESPVCAQVVGAAKAGSTIANTNIAVNGVKVAATSPSYLAPCQAIKSTGSDALFMAVSTEVAVHAADQCAQVGYKPVYSANTNGVFGPSWLKDKVFENATITSGNANYLDPSVPAVKTMYDALNGYESGMTDKSEFNGNLSWAWGGGQLFAAAAKAVNISPTSTAADVKKGLYALKDETLGGFAPPLNFKEGQPNPPGCYFNLVIKSGKLVSADKGTGCLDASQVAAVSKLLSGG